VQTRVRFQSCVDSLEAAVASADGGADSLELCARLEVGGLTPAVALVEATLARVRLPVSVMIRPREGDFVYASSEVATMVDDIRAMADLGVNGVVVGALNNDGTVDDDAMDRLVDAAGSCLVTFHRAFDRTPDLDRACDALLTLGLDFVLTSGGAATAAEGAATLARLVGRCGDDLAVIAAGTVRADHVARLVAETRVAHVHARLITGACTTPGEVEAARAAVAEMKAALAAS
jgi:copper homeostasis protein